MVHCRPSHLYMNDAQDSWKLCLPPSGESTKRFLDQKGVQYRKTAPKARLDQLYFRTQRGLPCYDKCSGTELRAFCQARRLDTSDTAGWTRDDLIRLLEEADENASFPFMDLPPEIRVPIYTMHLQEIETWHIPVQPPLTRVSRLVREESIPIFYQTCRFEVHMASTKTGRGPTGDSFPHYPAQPRSNERFLRSNSAHVARFREQIPRLYLSGRIWDRTWHTGMSKWQIVLGSEAKVVVARIDQDIDESFDAFGQPRGLPVPDFIRTVVEERVQRFVQSLRERGPQLKLEAGDADALRELFVSM